MSGIIYINSPRLWYLYLNLTADSLLDADGWQLIIPWRLHIKARTLVWPAYFVISVSGDAYFMHVIPVIPETASVSSALSIWRGAQPCHGPISCLLWYCRLSVVCMYAWTLASMWHRERAVYVYWFCFHSMQYCSVIWDILFANMQRYFMEDAWIYVDRHLPTCISNNVEGKSNTWSEWSNKCYAMPSFNYIRISFLACLCLPVCPHK